MSFDNSKVIATKGYLLGAADAIRRKLESQDTFTLPEFEDAIDSIETGGNYGTLNVIQNGTYTPTSPYDAYDEVEVNVPQTTVKSLSITENGTYNAPTGSAYSPVIVNVPIPSVRVVSEYDFTTESLEDKIRPNIYAQTNRGDVPTTDGILIDHNFDGVYPNYSFQQGKDYIIEVSIGNWSIQPPTGSYNRKLLGIEYRSYTGSASTNGLSAGYYPILYYDRTLDTPKWTVNNETDEDYFANKTVFIKLVNYYDATAHKIQIKVYYSEDGETYTDTGIVISHTNCYYGVVVGTEATKTNTDASTIKNFYLKKLKITECDTNISIS